MLFVCILLLIILFVVSKYSVKSLSELILKITRSKTFTVHFLALLFFPGVIIHELSHLLTAGVLFVNTGEMELWPKIEDDSVVLGSVKIAETDPLRRAVIGASPLIVGLALMLFSFYAISVSELDGILKLALLFIIVFELSSTMFSSKKDMEGSLVLIAILSLGALSLLLIGVDLVGSIVLFSNYLDEYNILNNIFYVLAFAILINVIIYTAAKILIRK